MLGNNQASQQGPALKDWKLEGILPALGDRAVQFITESGNQKEPFLVYMPLTSPHTPLAVNHEWQDKSHLNRYADFVMETDAVVGRVLGALEKSGAADNTLVIFTADNGCAPYIGVKDLEQMGHYPSGPLRGYKSDAWEGGHRVPFLVRWPGVVKPGSVCNQLVYQGELGDTLRASAMGVVRREGSVSARLAAMRHSPFSHALRVLSSTQGRATQTQGVPGLSGQRQQNDRHVAAPPP